MDALGMWSQVTCRYEWMVQLWSRCGKPMHWVGNHESLAAGSAFGRCAFDAGAVHSELTRFSILNQSPRRVDALTAGGH